MKPAYIALGAALFMAPANLPAHASPAAPSAARPALGDFGIDLSGMDHGTLPGDDFYRFVNGGWDERTAIPVDQGSWGGVAALRDLSERRTLAVMEGIDRDPLARAPAKKAGLLFRSFMNETAIEARGVSVLKVDLATINAIATPSDLAAAFSRASRDGIGAPIGVSFDIDDQDPDGFVAILGQGGLGLPDREYYLVKDSAKFVEARSAYRAHIAKMLTLARIQDADRKAADILALETRIAEVHWSRAESRQVDKRYNPLAAAALAGRFPGIDWAAFLGAAHLVGQPKLIISQPSEIEGVASLMTSVPLATWRAYLAYRTINARVDILPKGFVDEDFTFQKVLSGSPELRARWKRGVDYVDNGMGEAVGQLYVAHYFPPEAKAKADELVRNLLAAMKVRLEQNAWMTPETKAKALEKLAALRAQIGYPSHFNDYATLRIEADDAYGNELRYVRYDYDRNIAKLGKLTDRTQWYMTPQTVNAYANPAWTEVVVSAAILQPPFFDPNADPAVNYGGIGALIGHEISHHFDDQGRKYDSTGRLADWWTPSDISRFKTYTDRVEAQYSAYEPLPGVHVNGETTLGENIADLAGVNVALDAYHISLGGKPANVIDGYTGDQRFFLGFAQMWRTKMREDALRKQLATNAHAPAMWRPYVVRNLDAWYDAFDVRPDSKFYLAPVDRIKIW